MKLSTSLLRLEVVLGANATFLNWILLHKIRTKVTLYFEIPAQIFILNRCFLWGLSFPGVPSFLKEVLPWCSNQMALSSVKITFSKSLLWPKHSCVKAQQITWFAFRTIWQRCPYFPHLSSLLALFKVEVEKWLCTCSWLCMSICVPVIKNTSDCYLI